MTKSGVDAIGMSTTLESNKNLLCYMRQSSIPPPVMHDNHSYWRQVLVDARGLGSHGRLKRAKP